MNSFQNLKTVQKKEQNLMKQIQQGEKKQLKPSSLGVQLRIKRMVLGPANHTISIHAQV